MRKEKILVMAERFTDWTNVLLNEREATLCHDRMIQTDQLKDRKANLNRDEKMNSFVQWSHEGETSEKMIWF